MRGGVVRTSRVLSRVLWSVVWLGWVGSAQAGVFNTARTLKPTASSLAVATEVGIVQEGGSEVSLSPDVNLFYGVGVVRGVDFQLRAGFPLAGQWNGPCLGGDVEVGLLSDGRVRPAVSLTVGGHVVGWQYGGLDGTLMVSKVLGRMEPYVALDTDVDVVGGAGVAKVMMVGGVDVHLARRAEMLVEVGRRTSRVSGDVGGYVSVGFNFYLAASGY